MSSKITDKKSRYLTIGLGDCHIYKGHYEAVKEQLGRDCKFFPKLEIRKELREIRDIESLCYEDFKILNYNSWGPIKVEMVV